MHFTSAPDPLFERAAIRDLQGAGVELDAATSKAPPAAKRGHIPGVLFFDSVDADLAREVRNLTRGGISRMLAIATPAAILAPDDAWWLMSEGASDVFSWDHSTGPADEVAARLRRWADVEATLRSEVVQANLVGESPAWLRVLRQIIEVARYTDASILITGESGTGKELTARLVHTLDTRHGKGRLVVADCTTIVPNLSGSEFFGHERGAFTGAVSARDGAFALADGGTLFLDEVGELPTQLQAELLRVIQEGTYKRVGSDTWRTTQFRLICATNRQLEEAQAIGSFRKDLYHRIAAWVCELPPLRDRASDILPLARWFLQQFRPDQKSPEFDPAVRQYLLERDYHGNVRELRQVVHRLHTRHVGGGPITIGDIPDSERGAATSHQAGWADGFRVSVENALSSGATLREIGRAAQDAAIELALVEEGGSVKRASRRLGVSDRALQMRRSTARVSSVG